MELDNNKSKASFISWSKTHPILAVGTDKVYNFKSFREIYFFIIGEIKKKYLQWVNIVKKLLLEIGILMDF